MLHTFLELLYGPRKLKKSLGRPAPQKLGTPVLNGIFWYIFTNKFLVINVRNQYNLNFLELMSFFTVWRSFLLEIVKYRFQEFINVAVLSFVQQKWSESVVQVFDPDGFKKKFNTRFQIDAVLENLIIKQ